MTENVPLASLVEDFDLYPRNNVDDTHIADLVRALASGARFPPIIAEAGTLKVVDGIHRRRSMLRFFGDDVIASVELRQYESESALFLEAVALNSIHGRRLDKHDQTKIVLRLRSFGIDDKVISVTLHVPEPIVQKLSVRVVMDEAGMPQPAKRGMEHMHGQTLSPSQLDAVGSVRSAEAGRLCIELTRLLEARVVNLADVKIISRLRQLSAVIDAVLESIAA